MMSHFCMYVPDEDLRCGNVVLLQSILCYMKCSTSSVTFEIVAMSLYHTNEYRMFVAKFTKPLLAKVSCSQIVTLITLLLRYYV